MGRIKTIKSSEELERALNQLISLMDRNPEPGSAESDEIEALVLIIEHYERKNFPIDPPDPVDATKFRMDQQQLSQKR